ncbi:MAG: riboflavin kinase, partial [Eubacteriales bacterium]
LLKNADKFGVDVQVVPPVLWGGEKISSTRIRALVAAGNVAEAAKMLGGYYFASGRLQVGNQTGTLINVPSISIKTAKIKPACGVYATFAEVEGKHYGSVTSVSVQPDMGPRGDINIETNIFDLISKPYNQVITVHFVERLRDGMAVAGLDEPGKQIEKDRERAQEILQNAQKQTVYKPETV